jgi:quercetin dioxygenase-like cupin family protein
LPRVKIFPVNGELRAGFPQTVLVQIEPEGRIPLHSHTVAAEMVIVAGSGWVCSADDMNNRPVSPGCRVFFEADKPHGFHAGDEGLSFVSVNAGIVDDRPEQWDYDAAPR